MLEVVGVSQDKDTLLLNVAPFGTKVYRGEVERYICRGAPCNPLYVDVSQAFDIRARVALLGQGAIDCLLKVASHGTCSIEGGSLMAGSGIVAQAMSAVLSAVGSVEIYGSNEVSDPPIAIYSMRRVSPTYFGPALRVRRSVDNGEQDIGYDGAGDLDISGLTAFVGAGDGYVVVWYDQSSSNVPLVSETAASQPFIVVSGSVVLDGGFPAIRTSSLAHYMKADLNKASYYPNALSVFAVYSNIGTSVDSGMYQFASTPASITPFVLANYVASSGEYRMFLNAGYNLIYSVLNPRNLHSLNYSGSEWSISLNGSVLDSYVGEYGVIDSSAFYIGTGYPKAGDIAVSEVIVYGEDKSAARGSIEDSINSYYSIY